MFIDKEKVGACLLGVRVGDALGQPVETMTRQAILEAEVPGKPRGLPISTFMPAIQKRIKETEGLKAGDTTDDWQLTEVVAKSYIGCRGYDHESMAISHVEARKTSTTGWGWTSENGIEQIGIWYETEGQKGRDPYGPLFLLPEGKGAGNGVAMKVAPVALFRGARMDDPKTAIYDDVRRLAWLTHPDLGAMLCAYALALVIWRVARYSLATTGSSQEFLEELILEIEQAESQRLHLEEPATSQQLKKLRGLIGDPEGIWREITPGFLATQSVIYSIGIFLTYPTDFRKAVLLSVNDGLDSDSTASMVGALIAANCGLSSIPLEWQTFRPEYADTLALGEELWGVAAYK
jgi:ADP-ribosylglycohydrolase